MLHRLFREYLELYQKSLFLICSPLSVKRTCDGLFVKISRLWAAVIEVIF